MHFSGFFCILGVNQNTTQMMNQEVRRIMTTDPVVVGPTERINKVAQLMVDKKIQQIPVVEDGKLLGLITSYDLWKDNNVNAAEANSTVEQVMNKNVLVITPKDKVGTAAQLFMDKRFKTLPVVNLRNELKGVVTAFDVIRHSLTQAFPRPILYPEVFEEIEK